jgi:hypothetical protein
VELNGEAQRACSYRPRCDGVVAPLHLGAPQPQSTSISRLGAGCCLLPKEISRKSIITRTGRRIPEQAVIVSCPVVVLTCTVVVLTCPVVVLTCTVVVLTCTVVVLTCTVVVLTCTVVVLTCTVVVLTCFVMCGCVYVWVF